MSILADNFAICEPRIVGHRRSGRYDGVDWAKTNVEIGKALGVSKQAVSYERRSRGIPRATVTFGRRDVTARARDWLAEHLPLIYSLNVKDIVDLMPDRVSHETVTNLLCEVGYETPGLPLRGPVTRVRLSKIITTDNFRDLVVVNPITGCWEWRLRRRPNGYGTVAGQYAHRFTFELYHGRLGELYACHHCDNPPCCNPEHIYAGTPADNMRDRDLRGRTAKGQHSKLTERVVAMLRVEYAAHPFGFTQRAGELGVAPITLRQAIRGEKWKHVSAPPVPKEPL